MQSVTKAPVQPALKRSKDQKTQYSRNVGNAFGLPAVITCPGHTSFCLTVNKTTCYAALIEARRPNVKNAMGHNLELLQNATLKGKIRLLEELVVKFENECHRKKTTANFRIHWDGDFFDRQYTKAWASVIANHPAVLFWAYTRSFSFVKELENLPNLVLYLSVDIFNTSAAKVIQKNHPWVKIAACGKTWSDSDKVMANMQVKGPRCPELNGALPLTDTNGVGACAKCELCVVGRGNVKFADDTR